MINGHYASIMRKEHHSKDCGHNDLHGISVVLLKEQELEKEEKEGKDRESTRRHDAKTQ